MSEPAAESLARIELLKGLPASERKSVEQTCRWRRYAAHEQIIDRQSASRDLCFVVEGKVRVVNYSLSGREVTLDDLGPGQYFGELAALDGQPRSASVMALKSCLIAALPPEVFLGLVAKHSDLALDVLRHLATIVRNSTDRIMDLSTLAANNRVQADLLRQARNSMTGDNTASIQPIPIHGDIASRVSTTRETVARVLNDLARQGVVERTKDSLVIHDIKVLSAMVEEVRGE